MRTARDSQDLAPGIRGQQAEDPVAGRGADDATAEQAILVVASDVAPLHRSIPQLDRLSAAGYTVRAAYLHGTPSGSVTGFRDGHRLKASYAIPWRSGLLRRAADEAAHLGLRAGTRVLPQRGALAISTRLDPWYREAVLESDLVLALDEDGEAALAVARSFSPRVRLLPANAGAVRLSELVLQAELREIMDPARPRTAVSSDHARAARTSVRLLADSGGAVPYSITAADAAGVATRLFRGGRNASALSVAKDAGRLPGADAVAPGLRALQVAAELSEHGRTDADVGAVVREALGAADAAVGAGRTERAALLAMAAMGLLFHRELHVDVEQTDLIDDPDTFLAPARASRVMGLLGSAVRPRDPLKAPSSDRRQVVVLPGAYGRFASGIVAALEADESTDLALLDLPAADASFRGVGLELGAVTNRLRHALGEATDVTLEHLEVLEKAHVVFADWCDKGAVWASMFVPRGVRLVIRLHSVDALTPWPHLVDWSRVSALVFVSEHVRDVVQDMLGDRLSQTQVHVVPNVIDAERFRAPKRPEAPRTLAVVGWAQRVKDPLWAVEVLAGLLARGGDWRLLLIGHDFRGTGIHSSDAYAERFRRRAVADDVREHIEYVGYTTNLAEHLRGVGYAISSSVREAAPVGVTEAAASGAVPVIREWPVYARRHGASRQFPRDWVVDSVEGAVERIRSVADAGWEAASERTVVQVDEWFGLRDVSDVYRAILLDEAAPAPGDA